MTDVLVNLDAFAIINRELRWIRRNLRLDYVVAVLNLAAFMLCSFAGLWIIAAANMVVVVFMVVAIRKLWQFRFCLQMEKQTLLYVSNKIAGMTGQN